MAYAEGRTQIIVRDPQTWETKAQLPSDYPPATSLLQVPFVFIGGWRGAPWSSFAAMSVIVVVTANWLKRRNKSIAYAAVVPLFLPVAVLARSGMSDLPSAAVVVTALWLLQESKSSAAVLGGGLLAGISLAFRDSNPVFLAPTVLGCLRRRKHIVLLAASGVAGVGVRFLLARALQGDALILRPVYPFTMTGAGGRALLYTFALSVFIPGGVLAVAAYRGEWRAELMSTVGLAWAFFSLYSYSGQHSGLLKSLVLGPRYVIPLIPLIAIAIGAAVEKHVERVRLRRGIEILVLSSATIVSIAVHPILHIWSERQARLVRALYAVTSPDALLVTEPGATAKYLNGLYGTRTIADKLTLPPNELLQRLERSPVQLVFIDRSDSDYWRQMARMNQAYIDDSSRQCELRLRMDLTSVDRLRVFDVTKCH